LGVYIQPSSVVIAGSFSSTLGNHDGKRLMTPLSLKPYRYKYGSGHQKQKVNLRW